MVFMGGFMMILFLVPFHPWMKLIMQHPLYNSLIVQRMVISLSSDKSVWEAVMNNEVRDSVYEGCSTWDPYQHEGEVMEIVEKIRDGEQYPRNENTGEGEGAATEPFEKFFLSFGYGPPDHSLESGLQDSNPSADDDNDGFSSRSPSFVAAEDALLCRRGVAA
ncbi:hypothetical protein Ccrd_011533 [Cynara cardunculus var. scolymus]|uniref:Uncharacterized protein n=1 Tax=Cynara cardunculus var. scolymus TaxID=59895 RepID=A0A103YJ51_CYNCS|nr:hypothetical protein Ccrd_011533 [Cynara cardunculus var. scolymus]